MSSVLRFHISYNTSSLDISRFDTIQFWNLDTRRFFLGPQIIFKKFPSKSADIPNSPIFAHIGKQVVENTGFI